MRRKLETKICVLVVLIADKSHSTTLSICVLVLIAKNKSHFVVCCGVLVGGAFGQLRR